MQTLYQSKLKILGYAARKLWLLSLPILRIILINKLHPEPLLAYFKGIAFDIFVLLLILVYGYYKWKTKKFAITSSSIICRKGYFKKSEKTIKFKDISSIYTDTDWLIRKYNAIRVIIKTDIDENNFKDIELLMRQTDYEKIKTPMSKNTDGKRISAFRVIFFAELFSNIPHGFIMFGMVAWWFFDYVNVFLKFGLVFTLLLCKVISFLRNLEKLYKADISTENGYIMIKSGFFKKYVFIIDANKKIYDKYLLLYALEHSSFK